MQSFDIVTNVQSGWLIHAVIDSNDNIIPRFVNEFSAKSLVLLSSRTLDKQNLSKGQLAKFDLHTSTDVIPNLHF